MFYEFHTIEAAIDRRFELQRLGYRPFSIFKTARGTWAFHTP